MNRIIIKGLVALCITVVFMYFVHTPQHERRADLAKGFSFLQDRLLTSIPQNQEVQVKNKLLELQVAAETGKVLPDDVEKISAIIINTDANSDRHTEQIIQKIDSVIANSKNIDMAEWETYEAQMDEWAQKIDQFEHIYDQLNELDSSEEIETELQGETELLDRQRAHVRELGKRLRFETEVNIDSVIRTGVPRAYSIRIQPPELPGEEPVITKEFVSGGGKLDGVQKERRAAMILTLDDLEEIETLEEIESLFNECEQIQLQVAKGISIELDSTILKLLESDKIKKIVQGNRTHLEWNW